MTTNRFNLTLALLVAALATATDSSHAANPITSNGLTTVTVDGSKTFSGGQAVSVVNDGGLYHMWYRTGAGGTIGELSYATSGDGVSFTSQGALSFASDPFTSGTAPFLYYENVSKVGADFKIQHWTYNGAAGAFPDYNYNISVSDAGSAPSTTVAHQGAVSGGTFGQTAGSFEIVDGNLYMHAGSGRQLGRAAYTDGNPPSVADGPTIVANYQTFFDGLGISNGYINNHSDVIDLGGGSLGFFFTVRENSGVRFDQQVYFSELPNGGVAWTGALPTFASVTLDGGADSFSANFAHVDVVTQTGGYGLYLSSQNAAGDFIIATTIQAIPEPATLALAGVALLGVVAVGRRGRA